MTLRRIQSTGARATGNDAERTPDRERRRSSRVAPSSSSSRRRKTVQDGGRHADENRRSDRPSRRASVDSGHKKIESRRGSRPRPSFRRASADGQHPIKSRRASVDADKSYNRRVSSHKETKDDDGRHPDPEKIQSLMTQISSMRRNASHGSGLTRHTDSTGKLSSESEMSSPSSMTCKAQVVLPSRGGKGALDPLPFLEKRVSRKSSSGGTPKIFEECSRLVFEEKKSTGELLDSN